jgi:HPt (histidine-containing phosphotransfer) domain-containing protein
MELTLVDPEIIDSIREIGAARENDHFTHELYGLFAEQSDLALRELAAAIARRDLKQMRYYAHRLKGSAANIGACALARQAEELESAADDGATLDHEHLVNVTRKLVPLREQSLQALASLLLGGSTTGAAP